MENNDILIRVRYALDIKNTEMVEIFKLGSIDVTKEDVLNLLTKSKDSDNEEAESEPIMKCNNMMLESCFKFFFYF
jgi:uncharacterized protein YehS (DUF1456 family)